MITFGYPQAPARRDARWPDLRALCAAGLAFVVAAWVASSAQAKPVSEEEHDQIDRFW